MRRERQWLRDREATRVKVHVKRQGGENGARGVRWIKGEGSNASDGDRRSGSVAVEAAAETRVDEGSSESESESDEEAASRQAKAFA